MAILFRHVESDIDLGWAVLLLLAGWLLSILFLKILKSIKTTSYIHESVKIGAEITAWLRDNVRDGVPVDTLNNSEILALYTKDQELYDKIVKLNPEWKNTEIPPLEMHKRFLEIARGQYKETQ